MYFAERYTGLTFDIFVMLVSIIQQNDGNQYLFLELHEQGGLDFDPARPQLSLRIFLS